MVRKMGTGPSPSRHPMARRAHRAHSGSSAGSSWACWEQANNLPAYVAGEAAIPVPNHDQLLALIIGTNVGPIVAPWGSLATLIWFESCRRRGVRVPVRSFALTGAGLAALAIPAAVSGLLLTR